MNQAQTITFIPVGRLLAHPENPRKDLGDLTELTDSIRTKGILQNLTVVPVDADNLYTSYTVVIGHRRLAAAKAAGLESVPCVVTSMSYQEQIETMLLENMQRNDLTVYEQALGFQQLSLLGCPGYIVVDDALTNPLVGDLLFAPMERETFVTPMYCSDVWEARRAWNLVGDLFRAAPSEEKPDSVPATAPEADEEPVPALSEPSGVPEQVSFAVPIPEADPCKRARIQAYDRRQAREERLRIRSDLHVRFARIAEP